MPWESDALRQPSAHFAVRTQTQGKVTEEEGRTAQTYAFSCTTGSRGEVVKMGKTPKAMVKICQPGGSECQSWLSCWKSEQELPMNIGWFLQLPSLKNTRFLTCSCAKAPLIKVGAWGWALCVGSLLIWIFFFFGESETFCLFSARLVGLVGICCCEC